MKRLGKARSGADSRRGFTLAEMAIVLGILLLVFAGVFGLAQVARNRADINVASNQILQIISNMRDLYASRNIAAVPEGAPDMAVLVQSGVFPVDMLDIQPKKGALPAANARVHHAWSPTGDHSVQITSIQRVLNPPPGGLVFTLQFLNVPSDVCIELVDNNATPGPETGLTQITINGADFKATDDKLPPPKKEMVSACVNGVSGNRVATITWSFELSL